MKINFDLFRNNLMVLRTIQGLSAKELTEKCNLRQMKRISDIENGRGVPSLEEVAAICSELNVEIDNMLYKKISVNYEFV